MAGRYVPPALRRAQDQTPNASNENETALKETQDPSRDLERQGNDQVSLDDIHAHFWPPVAADTDQPARSTSRPGTASGTLNASAKHPTKLAYIILFRNANPRWGTDGIIFTKSNLELLPPATATGPPGVSNSSEKAKEVNSSTSNPELPAATVSQTLELSGGTTSNLDKESVPDENPKTTSIAVFSQDRGPQSGLSYTFIGWYQISRLTFLEPNSQDLARMLEQKWARTNARTGQVKHSARDPEKWKESLGYKWAVLKLERSREIQEDLVVGRTDHGGPENSVNEMLAEMRMVNKSE